MPLFRMVCCPAALDGWTLDMLRDGEVALLVDALVRRRRRARAGRALTCAAIEVRARRPSPHVTPLIGVHALAARMHFCTRARASRTARNLEHQRRDALDHRRHRGRGPRRSCWRASAVRVLGRDGLQRIADALEAKHGPVCHFDVTGDEVCRRRRGWPPRCPRSSPRSSSRPRKDPHGQTTFRFYTTSTSSSTGCGGAAAGRSSSTRGSGEEFRYRRVTSARA